MKRMKVITRWEAARIAGHSPGTKALLFALALPLLHLLPWRASQFFESPFQAAVMLSALYAVIVVCLLGRDAGAPRRSAFWLYQKGVAPLDYAVGAFLVALAGIVAMLAINLALLAAGLSIHGEAVVRTVAVVTLVSLLFALILHVLLFLIASLDPRRTSEAALFLVFLALTTDPLLLRAPASLRRVAHLLLPPVADAFQGTSALFNREWHRALGYLVHILAFVAVCFVLASMRQSRLRPAPDRLRAT